MEINGQSSYSIFDYVSSQQTGMDELSQYALTNAINYYQDGDYKTAVKEFRRSIALSPYSSNAVDTYNYMAAAYLQLDDAKNAEKAYESALRLDPQREDIHLEMGNLYFSQGEYEKAEKSYRSAVRIYPSAETYYSLAHCCLGAGKLNEAETYFNKVISLEPKSGNGQYGLGMTYAKQENYEMAIEQFERAMELNPDLEDARAELGYVLADAGRIEEATEQAQILEDNESDLSTLLYAYIYEVQKPQMITAYQGNFNWNLPMRTSIVALDNYLKTANETQYFSVSFKFNKDMDAASVQNPLNWTITRSEGYGPEAYNFGLQRSENDIDISRIPTSILYDADTRTAEVTFAIQQNDQADGVIDTSHIEFTFNGVDSFGLEMNSEANSFSRFNGFA